MKDISGLTYAPNKLPKGFALIIKMGLSGQLKTCLPPTFE